MIIIRELRRDDYVKSNCRSSRLSYLSLYVVFVMDLYLVLVEERDIVCCFLVFYEISEFLNKIR